MRKVMLLSQPKGGTTEIALEDFTRLEKKLEEVEGMKAIQKALKRRHIDRAIKRLALDDGCTEPGMLKKLFRHTIEAMIDEAKR